LERIKELKGLLLSIAEEKNKELACESVHNS